MMSVNGLPSDIEPAEEATGLYQDSVHNDDGSTTPSELA